MGFELLFNGVGAAFSIEHWGTNFLLRGGGQVVGIDCPDSYRRALRANGFEHDGEPLDVDALDAMIITHLHGDHVNGLEMVLAYRRYIVERKLDLYVPPPLVNTLWQHRLGASLGQTWTGERHESLHPEDYYDLTELPWERSVEVGPFEVTTRQTVHHIPTAALRISDGDATLGYSCDTEFDESLIEWLADCDLILHETSYGPGHTPLFELQELRREIRDKLVVVHQPDDLLERRDELDLRFAREGEALRVEA